ncbi:AAHS family 4-hydroxybenzoate transporter-like MFS transporter [Novosphingobium sp. SG751A]|uniref:MFS transporter n=1 Tax=Novosphingobium sp. SG751A TaxID=2587000 RepID=UPI0015535B18|nr:MFS transporter [Novosphingobium sp. SG751A]NOW48750.1 AAHS family 4-hydroxybenzoate transporter-like MFS transporter [Novosphingobium sp. SG751A]
MPRRPARGVWLYRLGVVMLIALTVVLDGLDNQMLGLAAPALLHEWGLERSVLGGIFALGFVGMALGTLLAGQIGDQYGRRVALLLGVALFGAATLATGCAGAVWHLALLKALAGVGLGGVPGTAAAMIAEFTTARWRSLAVTFGVVCVSIGGILGGGMAATLLPLLGWRWLFWASGALTMVVALFLLRCLPESPGFMARDANRRDELARLLRRLGETSSAAAPRAAAALPPLGELLKGDLARSTMGLSAAMLSGMFLIYLMFNWAPMLLSAQGFSLRETSLGLTWFNMGGTAGAMLAALAIMRVGSRLTLPLMAGLGALVCALLASLPMLLTGHGAGVMVALALLGLTASAAQSAMFALGAHAFPLPLRARGMGLMGAAGRIGALASAFAGSWLVVGWAGFFATLGALMVVNMASFLAVRGHIPPLGRGRTEDLQG